LKYIKKTIMLTNDKKDIGVLNIVKNNAGVFANFRNYSRFNEQMVLGIKAGHDILKKSVICNRSGGYDFKLSNDFDLDGSVACVLMDGDMAVVWGSVGNVASYKSEIMQYVQDLDNVANINISKSNVVLKEDKVEDDKSLSRLEEDKTNNDDKAEEEVIDRHEIFAVRDSDEVTLLSKEDLFDVSDADIEKVVDSAMAEEGNFYEMIREQIDALFDTYPEETRLSDVVPNSRWVQVDYENNGKVYVLGLIYDMEVVKYVAYGVPAYGDDEVPDVLNGYSQWIPLDATKPDGEGYFVMFQDANTGENVVLG